MNDAKTQRKQLAFVLACLVVGVAIVVWTISQRHSRAGRKVVLSGDARAVAAPTSRVAATRPGKMAFLDALHVNIEGRMENEKVLAMLAEDPGLARVEDERHRFLTPLHVAAFEGNLEVAKALVEAGAELDAREFNHNGTPLSWAAFAGEVEMVKWLLNKGATVDDEALVVAVAGVQGRAYRGTTQPAVYREIQKLLRAKASKHAGAKADGTADQRR